MAENYVEEVTATGTTFSTIYNRFLGKITDDMYMELTPEDTIKDLQNLLVDAIPGFEFPRVNLLDYEIKTEVINEADAKPGGSAFKATLTTEEVNILALLMKQSWIERQVASIENIRMKYSGPDFKMTSQANHLQKLLSLLSEAQRESFHMQRLYKRRKISSKDGRYRSNWTVLRQHSTMRPPVTFYSSEEDW